MSLFKIMRWRIIGGHENSLCIEILLCCKNKTKTLGNFKNSLMNIPRDVAEEKLSAREVVFEIITTGYNQVIDVTKKIL